MNNLNDLHKECIAAAKTAIDFFASTEKLDITPQARGCINRCREMLAGVEGEADEGVRARHARTLIDEVDTAFVPLALCDALDGELRVKLRAAWVPVQDLLIVIKGTGSVYAMAVKEARESSRRQQALCSVN